jgi:hypothetical protein
MGAARRKERRAAREAAKKLLKSGITPGQVGKTIAQERLKKFYLRILEQAEKKLEGGESKVSVREGMAAAKEIERIELAQAELAQAPAEEPVDTEQGAQPVALSEAKPVSTQPVIEEKERATRINEQRVA